MNGLEALEKFPEWLDDEHRDSEEKYFKASEEYKTIERELKALEIIKNKRVNVWDVLTSSDLHMYNYHVNTWVFSGKELTQDEFDLLKEVFK